MLECNCLLHPFQNDPGTSQRQRVMDELLTGAAKIDARTLADLLDYFVELSRHINYYDRELNVSDWQPFFKNSLPFTLASIINYKLKDTENNFKIYRDLFHKRPATAGLQLTIYFIYYRFICQINNWHLLLKNSGLPAERMMESVIKEKLQKPVIDFIQSTNAAVRLYGVKRIEFYKLYENKIWGIDFDELYGIDSSFQEGTSSKTEQINNVHKKFSDELFPVLLEAVKQLSAEAEKNLEQSLLPLKEELKEKHPAHLGLLFAFLNMFRHLQDDLNQYTRRHLDFFYKNILQFKSREAVPDKAHLLFEIQKQLKKYLLKKGLQAKNGKDDNKQQILFSLDDEIVVNKTELAETRTLFLNNRTTFAETYVEGLYRAPDATKADGVEIDFADGLPKNFPTVGTRLSKYADPETKIIKPYPNGRIGFILASPVLYLQAGSKRTITITLACQLNDSICEKREGEITDGTGDCCKENGENPGITDNSGCGGSGESSRYPNFYRSDKFYTDVNNAIRENYYYFNQDILKQAKKKGISNDLAARLREHFLLEENTSYDPERERDYCNCPAKKDKYEGVLRETVYNALFAPNEIIILSEFIKPRRVLKILFSGEKEWIEPVIDVASPMLDSRNGDKFMLTIKAVLPPEKPSVTFYDKEKLKEDFNTTQPLVKIELDDKIKLFDNDLSGKRSPAPDTGGGCVQSPGCCLLKRDTGINQHVSFYHFFRNIEIIKNLITGQGAQETRIDVQVCGLRNLIVQSDENVEDVNKLMRPFGVRPKVGANFYVGSKEVFMKNWQEIWVNVEWKDRPEDIKKHYEHYSYEPYEDGSLEIKTDSFKTRIALLENGNWKMDGTRVLFTDPPPKPPPPAPPIPKSLPRATHCAFPNPPEWYEELYYVNAGFFSPAYVPPPFNTTALTPFNIASGYGFLRFTLDGVSFQHDRYAYVLMRHILALSALVDDISVKAAQDSTLRAQKFIAEINLRIQALQAPILNIANDISNNITVITTPATGLQALLASIPTHLNLAKTHINNNNLPGAIAEINISLALNAQAVTQVSGILTNSNAIQSDIDTINDLVNIDPGGPLDPDNLAGIGLNRLAHDLKIIIDDIADKLKINTKLKDGLPKEPYTPTIKSISIDYTATAPIKDIGLIHLYPFEGTYKQEEIELQPTLLPTFCNEGTLFLGLKELVPGNNLNILFQLAEATSDSESEKEEVYWHYLDNNVWKPLRNGFEVLDDATENLTTSGIIKFALPANMSRDNTIMPKDLHWIKASIPKNSKAVSETTGIHPQAIRVTFTNDAANDKRRLTNPLPAESISKLNEADANVKSVKQPYESFDGRVPEMEGQFYVRTSEWLRHKGRAVQSFDYERLALEAFPQLYKVKCINHSFALNAHQYKNDFPYAPGYVILAVIPDLFKLKAGNSFEPKAPVSLLEKVDACIRKRTSPFVRFRAVNPRYEKINFCLRVQLIKGKDENFYREKLKQDLREFLAPWAVGYYDKLTFGQCVYRSDIFRFLETRDYVDFITDFRMGTETEIPSPDKLKICPGTPRSILIAGNIEVCIDAAECESWASLYSCSGNEQIITECDHEPEKIIDYCLTPGTETE